jgi:hypothetical protein
MRLLLLGCPGTRRWRQVAGADFIRNLAVLCREHGRFLLSCW